MGLLRGKEHLPLCMTGNTVKTVQAKKQATIEMADEYADNCYDMPHGHASLAGVKVTFAAEPMV